MTVLVVDVGGSRVKVIASGHRRPRRFTSGKHLTPELLVTEVRKHSAQWKYEAISLGIPARIDATGVRQEPGNLGAGWVGFDFAKAFARPVRVVNDAAMQALGAYKGRRMLFLGLGTGLGSALVAERVVLPMELGDLRYSSREKLGERIGRAGLKQHGLAAWLKTVHGMTHILRRALAADYVVLGGGNAELVDPLPEGARRGGNDDAFEGGFRLWREPVKLHDHEAHEFWHVVG